jgi:glycosyltransferase involved in cell wall biosynthesis
MADCEILLEAAMHVCLVSVELFAWGKYGGFGRATRTVGRELARCGVEVSAVVPRRPGQADVETLDGITVYGFPRSAPWKAAEIFRRLAADVYHSQEPSWGTRVAMGAAPDRKHVITFRDTRTTLDWWIELANPSHSPLQVLANLAYEDNPLVHRAVRRADALFCASEHLAAKARRKYRLSSAPAFLPTPVEVPAEIRKSAEPTVCYNGRWDRRKRPELFFELAGAFPHVRFIAFGGSRDAAFEADLRRRYRHLANLDMMGFVDQFASARVSEVLERSWVLVNTSLREGLPNAFLEAAAHGCALLSAVDPDGFASRFGSTAPSGDFVRGLHDLLEGDRWRRLGQRGRQYVRGRFATEVAVERHIEAYARVLTPRSVRSAPSRVPLAARTAKRHGAPVPAS